MLNITWVKNKCLSLILTLILSWAPIYSNIIHTKASITSKGHYLAAPSLFHTKAKTPQETPKVSDQLFFQSVLTSPFAETGVFQVFIGWLLMSAGGSYLGMTLPQILLAAFPMALIFVAAHSLVSWLSGKDSFANIFKSDLEKRGPPAFILSLGYLSVFYFLGSYFAFLTTFIAHATWNALILISPNSASGFMRFMASQSLMDIIVVPIGETDKRQTSIPRHKIQDPNFQYDELFNQVLWIRHWLNEKRTSNSEAIDSLISIMTTPLFLDLLAGKKDKIELHAISSNEKQQVELLLSELFLKLHLFCGRSRIYFELESSDTNELSAPLILKAQPESLRRLDISNEQSAHLNSLLSQPLTEVIEEQSPYEGTIQGIGIITRNRTPYLRSSLDKLLENITSRFKHIPKKTQTETQPVLRIAVFDDSNPDFEEENRQVIAELQKKYEQYRVQIIHVDQKAKKAFNHKIKERINEAIHQTLDLALNRSAGGNRNWVALQFGKHPYMMMDDDVHPFVSTDRSKKEPVDILGNMNRAMGIGLSTSFYEYSIHRDLKTYEMVFQKIESTPNDQEISSVDILRPKEHFYTQGLHMDQKLGFAPTVGGIMAVNPGKWPPVTMPVVQHYLRIEDFMIGIVQEWIYAKRHKELSEQNIFQQGGAIDHTKSPSGRRSLAHTIFYELISRDFVGLMLQEVLNNQPELAQTRIDMDRQTIKTIAQSIQNASIQNLTETDVQFKIKSILFNMMILYVEIKQLRNMTDQEETLSEFRQLIWDIFKIDMNDEELVERLIKSYRKMEPNSDVSLQKAIERGTQNIDAILGTEVREFGKILEHWPTIVDAAREIFTEEMSGQASPKIIAPHHELKFAQSI